MSRCVARFPSEPGSTRSSASCLAPPRGLVGTLVAALLALPCAAKANVALSPAISFGGGVHAVFDDDLSEAFGPEPRFTLGLSAPLTPGDLRVAVEFGVVSAEGQVYTQDPTFDLPDATCRWYPISIGFRGNTVPLQQRGTVGLWIGAAVVVAPLTYEDPFGKEQTSVSSGCTLELRPEVRVHEKFDLWARAQLALMTGVEINSAAVSDLSLSGNGIEFGLAYRFANQNGGQ